MHLKYDVLIPIYTYFSGTSFCCCYSCLVYCICLHAGTNIHTHTHTQLGIQFILCAYVWCISNEFIFFHFCSVNVYIRSTIKLS